MLTYWFHSIRETSAFGNVFSYLTTRMALAALTAFVVMVALGRPFIAWLRSLRITENTEKTDSPRLAELHKGKSDTPTMGGLLVIAAITFSVLLWARLDNPHVLIGLYAIICCGLVGFVDDVIKLKRPGKKGMGARVKMFLLTLIAFISAGFLYFSVGNLGADYTTLFLPFAKNFQYELGLLFVPVGALVIVSSANAVNLTDGLDGLAIMPAVLIGSALGVFAYAAGNVVFSGYLGIPYVPGSGEMLVFCAALAGAGLGFLWFNTYPAQVFMGDIGALALGAALGLVAVVVRQELVLFIMGGVFVVETVSVIIQVASYKMTGRRVFRMAPLHHHFELKGWAEPKVIVRFWIITVILVLIGLASLKIR